MNDYNLTTIEGILEFLEEKLELHWESYKDGLDKELDLETIAERYGVQAGIASVFSKIRTANTHNIPMPPENVARLTKGQLIVKLVAKEVLLSTLSQLMWREVDKYDSEELDTIGELLRPYHPDDYVRNAK